MSTPHPLDQQRRECKKIYMHIHSLTHSLAHILTYSKLENFYAILWFTKWKKKKKHQTNEWVTNETSTCITASLSAREWNEMKDTKVQLKIIHYVCVPFWLFWQIYNENKSNKMNDKSNKNKKPSEISWNQTVTKESNKINEENKEEKRIKTRVHSPFITWTIALVPSALVGMQE